MDKVGKLLISKFFKEKGFVDSDIKSFNYLIEHELKNIIEENKIIEPTIIPQEVDSFHIQIDNIWIEKPTITEADGSKRDIYPVEARLRKITYAAPIFLEVSSYVNGVQRESFSTQIGNLPIMLKSKFCHLSELNRDELIKKGEDPEDPGGYFIVNGSEKVLIDMEDLASNRMLVEKANIGPSEYVGKLFSEKGSYKIPHTFEKLSDGIFYLTFTRVKRIPAIIVIKALGLLTDEEIMTKIGSFDEVFINLLEFKDVKTQDDALDIIGKAAGITQTREIRIERAINILERYLLPHVGVEEDSNNVKAINLCKALKKFIKASNEQIKLDDKDHYMNKRLKLAGELLADLIRVNLRILVRDILYNFQRIVKRGKFPSIKVIIREKLLTGGIYSSMATGNWVGGRKGISQRIDRTNFLATLSHLQRVVSPLSASQENFGARELHGTHFGRLCPSETPEGTNIGLRKNLAILCDVSNEADSKKIFEKLKEYGLNIGE